MESYVLIDGKKYRRGYTTGTTATAAAMAAALSALGAEEVSLMAVRLPGGESLEIPVSYGPAPGTAGAFKDGGDDIDQTNGLEIRAEVRLSDSGGIQVFGGAGVGRVTKPGLQVPVGDAAINPVPLQMIASGVRSLIGETRGAAVWISVPGGEAAAQKTFNPKLGILGGISIIGTTGIVEPMSEEAWKKSLDLELHQLRLTGAAAAVLVPGNHGERFAVERLGFSRDQIATMSNFVGYLLMGAVREGFEKVVLVGHIGKLIKLAGGIFHTHSRVADCRNDLLCSYLAKLRAPYDLIDRVRESNTTDEAADLICAAGYAAVFELLALSAAKKCQEHTYGALSCAVFLYDMKGRLLGSSEPAPKRAAEACGAADVKEAEGEMRL